MMLQRWCLFVCMGCFVMFSLQHCSSTPTHDESTAGETTTTEANSGDASTTKETGGGTFTCGDTTCKTSVEMCKPYSPGACIGDPPDSNGKCKANCQLMQCGQSEGTCLCTTYSCTALPSGCNDCACVKKEQQYSFCECSEKNGGITINCLYP